MVVGIQPRYDTGYEEAMNEFGLAWDINSLPATNLNPHPEKPYSHAADNFLARITKRLKIVDEAVALAEEFDFGSKIHCQIHIADASGDAVIISSDPDGELAFFR